MSYFEQGAEIGDCLADALEDFLGSADGVQAVEAAKGFGERFTVVIRTTDPSAVVSVDFMEGRVTRRPVGDPVVNVQIEADSLHDILLDRLGPVEISALLETNRVSMSGPPQALGALIAIAGPLGRQYAASLSSRGREHLLETPPPTVGELWHGPDLRGDLLTNRRPWQKPRGGANSNGAGAAPQRQEEAAEK